MIDKGILFVEGMVSAILNGNKTQTRRICNLKPIEGSFKNYSEDALDAAIRQGCEYKVGQELYVRETWQYYDWTKQGLPFIRYKAHNFNQLIEDIPEGWQQRVMKVWADLSDPDNYNIDCCARDRRWRPSIHMPRWASRIRLKVEDIKLEKLNSISIDDAIAEGVTEIMSMKLSHGMESRRHAGWLNYKDKTMLRCPVQSFKTLWESIYGEGSFEKPWVFAITFKEIK